MIPADVVWLVRRVVPTAALSEAVLGDLEEDAARVEASSGVSAARWWCRAQLGQSLFSLASLGAPRRWRLVPGLVLSTVLGYASIVVLGLVASRSLSAMGIDEASAAGTAGRLTVSFASAILGGLLASVVARKAPVLGAVVLAALLWCLGLWWLLTEAQSPPLHQLLVVVGGPLATMAGALLRRPRT